MSTDAYQQSLDDLLVAVAEDPGPLRAGDRVRIYRAVRTAAAASPYRLVSPNTVRALLVHPLTGALDVRPRMLSAAYQALTVRGVLAVEGWCDSDDTVGRNRGKRLRMRRLIDADALDRLIEEAS